MVSRNGFKCLRLSLFGVIEARKPESLKCMILPLNTFYDDAFRVSAIVDDYVIYDATTKMKSQRFALKKVKGQTYTEGSHFDMESAYKIIGTKKFQTLLAGQVELYIVEKVADKVIHLSY